MTIFQVKTESPAVRCDICHQVDLFDPATGACTRCKGIDPDIATQSTIEITTRRPLYRYVGPRNRTFGAYCWNAYLGGLVAALFPSLPLFLFLLNFNFFKAFDGPLNLKPPIALIIIFVILPNTVAGIRTYRFLIQSNQPFELEEMWSAGQTGSVKTTLALFILLFAGLFGSQLVFGAPLPFETLFGILIPGIPLAIVCLFLNGAAGRLVVGAIRFIEKNRIVPGTSPLLGGKDSQEG